MFGQNSTAIIVGFLVLDMIVMIGVAYWITSRRKQNSGPSQVPPSQQSPFTTSTSFGSSSLNPTASAPNLTADEQQARLEAASLEDTYNAIALNPDIKQLVLNGRKIEAIKLVREQTKLDLKESKDLIEDLEAMWKFQKSNGL